FTAQTHNAVHPSWPVKAVAAMTRRRAAATGKSQSDARAAAMMNKARSNSNRSVQLIWAKRFNRRIALPPGVLHAEPQRSRHETTEAGRSLWVRTAAGLARGSRDVTFARAGVGAGRHSRSGD